jgi:hypothetical protein
MDKAGSDTPMGRLVIKVNGAIGPIWWHFLQLNPIYATRCALSRLTAWQNLRPAGI